jgi:signal transduction histidine kinase
VCAREAQEAELAAAEALAPVAAREPVESWLDADGAVTVVGDAHALDRVLRNVLDIAVRHAPGVRPCG